MAGTIVGYARTSTLDQKYGLESQIEQLKQHGAEKIFQEQRSSVEDRPELAKALEYLREGDTFVVVKLHRLARSVHHLLEINQQLEEGGVSLKILDLNIDRNAS